MGKGPRPGVLRVPIRTQGEGKEPNETGKRPDPTVSRNLLDLLDREGGMAVKKTDEGVMLSFFRDEAAVTRKSL